MQFRTLLIAALLTLPLLQILPEPAEAETGSYSENFETLPSLVEPDSPHYDYALLSGTGGAFVTGANPKLGNRAFRMDPQTTMTVNFDVSDSVRICYGKDFGTIAFAYRTSNVGTAYTLASLRSSSSSDRVDITHSSGVLNAEFTGRTPGTNTVQSVNANLPGTTFVANVWYNFTIAFQVRNGEDDCDHPTNVPNVVVAVNETSPVILTGPFMTQSAGLHNLRLTSTTPQNNGAHIVLDNLVWSGANQFVQPAVGAKATAAVTALTGFDVDPAGNTLIARTNQGEWVRTFNTRSATATLTQLNAVTTCEPLMADGVVASQFGSPDAVVGYLTCEAGTNQPDAFRIRNALLGNPNIDCRAECDFDISLKDDVITCTGEFADRGDLRRLRQVEELPLDFSKVSRRDRTFGFEDVHLAVGWAYTTTAGRLGVAKYVTQNGCNGYFTARTQYSTTEPEDFCFWGHNGKNYLAAVDFESPLKLYTYDAQVQTQPYGDGVISAPVTFGSLGGGIGLSCAADKMLVQQNNGRITLIDIDDGAIVWTKTVRNAPGRGVLLDPSATWAFFVDDPVAGSPTPVSIAYASNGTVVGSFTTGSGAWVGMRTDTNAQNLWTATEIELAWFEVARNLDAVPEQCTGLNCAAPSNPPPAVAQPSSIFRPPSGPNTLFSGDKEAGWFSGILMVIGMSVGLAAGGPSAFNSRDEYGRRVRWSNVLAGIGAALGVIMARAFGLFDNVTVFLIALFTVVILIAIWKFGGGRRGDGGV